MLKNIQIELKNKGRQLFSSVESRIALRGLNARQRVNRWYGERFAECFEVETEYERDKYAINVLVPIVMKILPYI